MEFDLLIKNGLVVTEEGAIYADVGIRDGKIAALRSRLEE